MANKFKPATKSDRAKVIKTLLKEGISKVKDTFEISNMAIQDVVYIDPKYYPECSVGCVLIEAHGEVVEDIIDIMKKLGYRYAEDFGDGIVLVFAPKGVSDSDIEDALNGKINESVDISVKEIVRSKIIKYAQDRLNKSGAVLLAPVYDMINFNDPLDGMISFDYLNTIAENDELSEEESGYDYIEQAVTDIANFIQNQGFIMDEDSDDPLIFIDENYSEEDDEELYDMNESVKWTETDEPNQWVNKLTKNKEAIDPITLECKDLGVAVFASKLSEDADNNFYKVMIVNSNTGKSMTKSLPFDGIDLESAISKLKKCDNKDDLYDTISKYLFLRKSDVFKLFGISMNEAVSITKTDNYDEFNLLPPGNKFMDPIKLENKELGIWATAGVMFDEDDPDNEDDYSAVVLVSPLDPKYENYVVAGDFSDNYSSAKNIMKKLAQIKTPEELAKIIKDKKFSDYYGIKSNTDFLVDIVRKLYSKMNESTMINEAASIKKSDRYKEFNLLPKGKGWMDPVELTNKDAGFYAIAGTAYDQHDRDNEDEWGIVVILAPLDEDYEDVVITGSFYDYEEAADGIMSRLSRAKTPSDVARIIKNQDFYDDYDDDESEFLSALTKSFKAQNESTNVINESAQIRPCDPALEGFDLLDSNNPFDFEPVDLENTELGFYAIAGVATGANPSAVWVEDDCSIEICITALDPDYTDEVLVAEYYDVDYKAMNVMQELASATSYNKLTSILVKEGFQGMNSGPFDFVDDLEAINSMNEATEVPDGRMTVELDDTDVVEGDTLLLAELTDDVFNAVNTVLDELDPDADVEITIDNEDLLQLAVVSDEDLDDDAFDQVLSELLEDMDLEDIVADMTDSEPIEDPEDEDFGRVIQYINFYPATGATVVPDNSVMEDNVDVIEDEDVINESFKLNTDLTKFVDKLADSFFGSIKDANFLNLEDEDGNLYFQVSTGDKSYSRKLLTNFLAFLAKKNVDFDLVNKVNVTGNSTFWNATVTVKINNKQGSQVQYRNELNESTDVSDRVWKYVDDFNFKSGVKFLEGDDKIEKVLKAISPKLDIRSYHLDKLPWTTYTVDGKDKVAVVCISGRLYSPMAIAITDGKNISDFVSNAKSTLVFTNKKLEDWNNVTIVARIMNNLAKATDRASEYKAIKSLLDKYEKQVYNYEQFDESVDDDNSEAIGSYDYSESAKSPKLPTQSELKTIIQKSMIKFGERHTQVTVHAYRTSKYEGGVVEVDLDGTSLATDGREEDYYDEDNIKNALEYAAKELVDKFGQDKDLLDYIDVQYNKVGSLTITFSLDSELNESYSMNEATKFDFDNLEEVLEEDLESDIDLPDYADNIIVNSYATGYGYGVKATFDDRLVKDNKLRIISRIVKTIADRCGKDYDLDHHHDKMRGEYSLTLNYKGSPVNESANYNKLSDKLETDLSDDIDNISDKLIVSVDETEYGHDIIVEFDDSLLGSNPNKIINQIAKSIQKRNGKYDDLIHYRQKYNNTYKLVFKYKGSLNECAIMKSEDTDYNALKSEELTRVLNSDQPLVDPYDIRCTIRPVFVRKDQFLFDGSTVYKAAANASTDKDSGTTEIKVDVLLSNDPDISDASMTLTLPTEFDGLKLLRGNPTKVYNESADVKADTVTLSFANEDEANEFIKDNGVQPEKSFEGKFGWTVILKKSDLKKIK